MLEFSILFWKALFSRGSFFVSFIFREVGSVLPSYIYIYMRLQKSKLIRFKCIPGLWYICNTIMCICDCKYVVEFTRHLILLTKSIRFYFRRFALLPSIGFHNAENLVIEKWWLKFNKATFILRLNLLVYLKNSLLCWAKIFLNFTHSLLQL